MSAQNLINLVRTSTTDNIVNGREVQNIISQASADGVITDGEKQLLRSLLNGNADSLTEQGRVLLERFLRDFSDAGDEQVTSPKVAVDLLRKNFGLIARGDRDVSRADLQATIDSPDASEQLKQAARWLLNNFNEYSNLAGARGDDKFRPADGQISLRDLQVGRSYTNMTRLEAFEVLKRHWNKVDTAGGTAERDNDANRYNLAAMVRDPNAPEELKAACRLLLNDEEAFGILDGGHNGVERGLFSLKDLNAAIVRESISNREIVSEMIRKFDDIDLNDSGFLWLFKSGSLTKAELANFIRHTPANSKAAAAARALAANDQLWDQIAGPDGEISLDDLKEYASAAGTTATTPEMNAADLAPTATTTVPASELPTTVDGQQKALQRLTSSYGAVDPDGDGIQKSDLQRIIGSSGASQELRVAAQFLLSHFDSVAGSDGRVSSGELQQATTRFGLAPTRALEILKANLGQVARGGSFDLARLKQIAGDRSADPELRAAAGLLAGDAELFSRVDNAAQGGRRDGRITGADLEVAISVGDMSDNRAAELVAFNFATIQSVTGQARAGGINVDDLRKIAEGSDNAELRAAAYHLLRSGLFDKIRRFAFQRGSQNGLVSTADLRAYMQANPLSTTPIGQARPLPAPAQTVAAGGAAANSAQTTQGGGTTGRPVGDTNSLYREIDSVLTDPGLSVEDKVAFMLMLLCKYMDKQIEAQMKYIQKLQLAYANQQEQQRKENLARLNGADDSSTADQTASTDDPNGTQVYGQVNAQTIDTEVMKLKRLVDKRGQIFDIMRQIIDKYNQTAKSIIDSIGR